MSARRAVALMVALVTLTAAPRPSQAMRHLKLARSSPAADTTLSASPDAIRLWMSEPTDAPVSKITLRTDAGTVMALGALTRGAAKDAPLVAPILKPLVAGGYKVTWKAMSKDGHVVNGTFAFHVALAK
ncbi:MAG: copper resistance protein CopC [Gemmatimonadaceae bacterium]|nr:copper resistance protein CopC [Gemmatimonadaceae bacterium]